MTWRILPVSQTELCIDKTLRCGQSFRWIRSATDGSYSCALQGRVISLRQDEGNLYYRALRRGSTSSIPLGRRVGGTKIKEEDEGIVDEDGIMTPPASQSAGDVAEKSGDDDQDQGRQILCDGREETEDEAEETLTFLRHYLNLDPNLGELYESWSAADANFRRRAPKFTGIRILRQDAWEALVGFICSSNNNIARISQMVRSSKRQSRVYSRRSS